MGTTYEYTYEYEIADPNKNTRTTAAHAGNTTQRSTMMHTSRSDTVDPLANLQHDRIWSKLYDPVSTDKAAHDLEVQRMARRQDRKIIKLEGGYGSDRQTFIVKRDYDLRVRDVIDEAARVFKIPSDQIILYWKGRNICETPDLPLETLGIENNNSMRICRADDQNQRSRLQQQQQLRSQQMSTQQGSSGAGYYAQQQGGSGGYYGQQGASSSGGAAYGQSSSSGGAAYGQSLSSSSSGDYQQTYYPSYQQQQTYYSNPGGYDQQYYTSSGSTGHHCNCSCHQDQHHNCKCCCHCHGSHHHNHQV